MAAAKTHLRQLEATNAGHYFADCSCGASLGVYPDRVAARCAWEAHRMGSSVPPPVKPSFLLGGLT